MTAPSVQYSGTGSDLTLFDLTTLRIFSQTVDLGSFSEVARQMDVTPAMVSKRIAALESKLGARLLQRNTRGLFPTEAGQRLYVHCTRALHELDLAASEISDLNDQPSGHLRITAPPMLGTMKINPKLPQFLRRHRAISLDVNFSLEKLDLLQHRIDIAVRIADSIDPGLIAIKMAPYSRVFCASETYLSHHGVPRQPEDLVHHNCIISRGSSPNRQWPVARNNEIGQISVSGTLATDSGELSRACALEGLGIIMAARWRVADDLRNGSLVELLPDFTPHNRAIYAVLAQRTDASRKLAVMVDFLKECFKDIA